MRIVHVISSLGHAGAETMLCKLLSRRDPECLEAEVVSLTTIGPAGWRIQALGVPVRALDLNVSRPSPLPVLRLAAWLRRNPPDLVQTWMYHADFIGGLAARAATRAPVLWNLRHSDFDPRLETRSQRLLLAGCARLSRRLPARIVCCSEASRRVHVNLGYAPEAMTVIPNGFDLEVFRPDPEARAAVRAGLGLAEQTPLVGLAARYHPQKDHETFLEAARRVVETRPDVRFLLCGGRVDEQNGPLVDAVRRAGLEAHCRLVGRRDDIERVNAALDVACSSSAFGEGFSNAVGEAMACGVPCVVTDVGDSARIVGDTGRVAPPRDPEALAAALLDLLAMSPERRRELGGAAQRRIADHFSLSIAVERYERLWSATVDRARPDRTEHAARRSEARPIVRPLPAGVPDEPRSDGRSAS